MINNIDILKVEKKYNEIINLKTALGIEADVEMSKSVILDIAKNHNKHEVFLLSFIIQQIKYMPFIIKEQFDYLIKNENTKDFHSIYSQTEKLYRTNSVFKNFYTEISNELEFDLLSSKCYLNSIIYETAYDEINEDSIFSSDNPIMNFYLLQKWLKNYEVMSKIKLSKTEKKVLKYLLEGYLEHEIISFNLIDSCNDNIHNIINHILPKKFNVRSIMQVLAIYQFYIA